jgi:cold-inducible RNA-binding protein
LALEEAESTDMKLFIGGLSWATTDDLLRSAFERFGDVTEALVILDRETGRSRGFGFVTFGSSTSAQQAVEEMNGASLDGRVLVVNEARERAGGGGGGGGGGGRSRYGSDRR